MLDNKDFWSALIKTGTEPQAKPGGADAEITLDPGYRAKDKPSTTDPPSEQSFDIDAILADVLKRTQPPASKPQPPAVAAPSAAAPPDAHLGDRELVQEMLSTVRELTAEVKQLRSQIAAPPDDVAGYLSEGLPGIAIDADAYAEYTLVSPPEEKPLPEEEPAAGTAPEKPQKKKGKSSLWSDILFYFTVAILIVCGTLYGVQSTGAPKSFAGYSVFTVLTSSMQREIPKDSLVITKAAEASELRVGDDITYLVNPTTTVTHRIVGIIENYENTGQRAFQTKGIMNDAADKNPVPAANVVGRVIYHNLTLGRIAKFITANIVPIIIFLVLFIVFFAVFKKILRKQR